MDKRTRKLMFSHESLEWYTPIEIYRWLDEIFHFDIDPSADETNRLGCRIFYTAKDDGLSKDWPPGAVFCNPPYGRKAHLFVKKCKEHAAAGKGVAVMLIACRTDTAWYHDYIYDFKNKDYYPGVKVWFWKGRIKFIPGPKNPKKRDPAAFASIVVIFWPPPGSAKQPQSEQQPAEQQLRSIPTKKGLDQWV
jgi:phage N-6-adenine-methyltransferase